METSISFEFDSLEYKIAIDYFNCSLNNSIDDPNQKELWVKILQLFFYSNEVDKSPTIINKVLNYLYTGKLGNGKFTSQTNDLLIDQKERAKIISHFGNIKNSKHLIDKRNFFFELYNLYLKILCKYFWYSGVGTKRDDTFDKILIYEAPPFMEAPDFIKHFMLNGDKYLTALDVNAKDSFYKLSTRCTKRLDKFISNNSGIIYKESRDRKNQWNLSQNKDFKKNLKKVVTSEIVYIDLILAPIYIDSELRKAWSTKDEFLFEDKQLPVILFEWAIEHFKHSTRNFRMKNIKENKLFSNNCLVAFGTPINTSVSIYEYFADKMFLIDTYGAKTPRKENHIDLTQLNSSIAFRKFENRGRGVVFPMFKSNVIGGSRYPDSMLVKHAFDIPDK